MYGDVELRTAKLKSGMREANASFNKLEGDAKKSIGQVNKHLSSLGSGMGDFLSRTGANILGNLASNAISGAVDKMKSLTEQGMGYYDSVQMTKMSFGTLLNDMEKGRQLTADMLKFARITPFDDQPVLKYSQSLLAAKVQAKDLQTYLTGIGNALAASGNFSIGPQEATVRALTQMRGKPTLMSEELKGQLADAIPSAVADMAAALDISIETLNEKMAAGAIKSIPATDLLIDYWSKKYAGLMKFAGENTFEGLKSSKTSAEAAAMANIFAGGDVMNPQPGAGSQYLQLLKDQIARRDEFAKGGPAQTAFGDLATTYLKAREQDDAALFMIADSRTAGVGGSIISNTVKKMGVDKGDPTWTPFHDLGTSIGEAIPGGKAWGEGGGLVGWAKRLFTDATGSAIDTVEKGKQPMSQAGAALGDSLIKGVKSPAGLDSQSPSKKAIEEGLNFRRGLAMGLISPSVDVSGAGMLLSEEVLASVRRGLGGGKLGGMSERAYLEQVGADPKVKAFFEAIKKAEGGGENVIVGGKRFSDLSDHPNIVGMRTSKGPSTAAGSWQITGSNWYGRKDQPGLKDQLGLTDFTEHSQYLAALKLFSDRGGLSVLLAGNILEAMGIAAKDWTSTPGSTIGGGGQKSVEQWMGYFNKALGANGAAVTNANPMPVVMVSALSGGNLTGGVEGWRQFIPAGATPIRNKYTSSPGKRSFSPGTIDDPFPIAVDVMIEKFEPLTQTFNELNMATTLTLRPLQELVKLSKEQQYFTDLEVAAEKAKGAAAEHGLTDEEIARKRREAYDTGATASAAKQKALSFGNISDDFQSGFQSALMNPLKKSSWGDAGMGFLKDIQAHAAQDLSSMLTGALFGNRDKDTGKLSGGFISSLLGSLFGGGKTTWGNINLGFPGAPGAAGGGGGFGGFLKSIFGSIFGGHKASGGGMSAGRFYIAGENGPEIITGPGHVFNASQTRGMMSGGSQPQRFIFVDDERAAEQHFNASDRNFLFKVRRNQRKMARIDRFR